MSHPELDGPRPVPPTKPYRIGVMVDIPHRPVFPTAFVEGLEFAFAEAFEARRIDRPVETVLRAYNGLPETDSYASIEAFRDLVENEHVLAVAGPFTTDNCLPILPHVERSGVPTLTLCGSQRWIGESAFNLSNGGMADEPAIIAGWLRSQGHLRVGVLRDSPSMIGDEYLAYFRNAAALEGVSIVLEEPTSQVPTQEAVTAAIASLKRAAPDAVVYLGLGGQVTTRLRHAFEALDWAPPRITTTALVTATFSKERSHMLDQWYGVDQYDERNTVLSGMVARYEAKHGVTPAKGSALACGYDAGRALALGLSRMRLHTPGGLRDALETVRRLPAANGAPGTIISFGPGDHRGYKGADYLVVRRATGGTTEFVCTVPVG